MRLPHIKSWSSRAHAQQGVVSERVNSLTSRLSPVRVTDLAHFNLPAATASPAHVVVHVTRSELMSGMADGRVGETLSTLVQREGDSDFFVMFSSDSANPSSSRALHMESLPSLAGVGALAATTNTTYCSQTLRLHMSGGLVLCCGRLPASRLACRHLTPMILNVILVMLFLGFFCLVGIFALFGIEVQDSFVTEDGTLLGPNTKIGHAAAHH